MVYSIGDEISFNGNFVRFLHIHHFYSFYQGESLHYPVPHYRYIPVRKVRSLRGHIFKRRWTTKRRTTTYMPLDTVRTNRQPQTVISALIPPTHVDVFDNCVLRK
jgi:hypothetical protein